VKLEIISGSPTEDELAAIAAALQFIFRNQTPEKLATSRWRLSGKDYLPLGQLLDWRAQGIGEYRAWSDDVATKRAGMRSRRHDVAE
jgi:hypothetical protein